MFWIGKHPRRRGAEGSKHEFSKVPIAEHKA